MRNEDNETEILLGNKQLLGIFFVVAVLLGVAFTGGYMVGHGSSHKTATTAVPPTADTGASDAGGNTGGETHSVGAEASGEGSSAGNDGSSALGSSSQENNTGEPGTNAKSEGRQHGAKSAARERAQRNEVTANRETEQVPANARESSSAPHSGQTFLQVAAVGREEAQAVADVLNKKGFRAHAVAKPGNAKIYRVLIGPVRDTSDLSSTRDSLRRAGFRDVIVQRY